LVDRFFHGLRYPKRCLMSSVDRNLTHAELGLRQSGPDNAELVVPRLVSGWIAVGRLSDLTISPCASSSWPLACQGWIASTSISV
jgi:hypothetical protein